MSDSHQCQYCVNDARPGELTCGSSACELTRRLGTRDQPMLTKRQRRKVEQEIIGLIGPMTTDVDENVIRFVAHQVGRQTAEEVLFCNHTPRGKP